MLQRSAPEPALLLSCTNLERVSIVLQFLVPFPLNVPADASRTSDATLLPEGDALVYHYLSLISAGGIIILALIHDLV